MSSWPGCCALHSDGDSPGFRIESGGTIHRPRRLDASAHNARKFAVKKAAYQLMGVIPLVV